MTTGLAGRRAVVVGGMSPLGRAVAEELRRAGVAALALVDGPPSVPRTAGAVEDAAVVYRGVDLMDEEALRAAVRDVIARAGGVDVFVSTLERWSGQEITDVSDAGLDATWHVNFTASVAAAQEAAEAMRSGGGGGVLLFVTTALDHGALPQDPVFAASKAALANLVKGAALKLAPFGIRVNCVAYGPTVETAIPVARHVAGDGAGTSAAASVPAGRLGTPRDVAAALAFLAGDDAAQITGHQLVVDGGATASSVGYSFGT